MLATTVGISVFVLHSASYSSRAERKGGQTRAAGTGGQTSVPSLHDA